MLIRCMTCGRLFDAGSRSVKALCPECLSREQQKAQPPSGGTDWREPLYAYALKLEARRRAEEWTKLEPIFIRLGDYRDAAQRLEKARVRMQYLCAIAIEDARRSERRTSLESAVSALRALRAMPQAAEALSAAEEKLQRILAIEEKARQEAAQRAQRRRRRHFVCSGLAAAALAVWLLNYVFVVFPGRLNEAEQLIALGRGEEALALCLRSEEIWETERGDRLLQFAQKAAAGQMREQGRFQEAAALYKQLNMEQELDETYDLWSDALTAQGNTGEAIRVLKLAAESEARAQRLVSLYMIRAGEAAQEAIARGAQDTQYARRLGEELEQLDAQLRYCHALHEAGFDLSAVYPSGVEIKDAKLAKYQIDVQDAEQTELPLEGALIFSRDENSGGHVPWLTYSMTIENSHDRTQDSLYRVRLLPGYMFREGASPVRSFDEADTVLLLDGIYITAGYVSAWTQLELPVGTRHTMRASYPYFLAVSSVAAYDLHNPKRMQVFACETDKPLCADEAWMAVNGEDHDAISPLSARMGELNMEAMREALDQLLFGARSGREQEGRAADGGNP